MAYLLHMETSTMVCSAGLSNDGEMIAYREDKSASYAHSRRLSVFLGELFEDASIKPADLSAVAVSQGPGSYTGLRIGVSSAKGLCYALDIPLIAVDTMLVLSVNALKHLSGQQMLQQDQEDEHGETLLCPMIDARRMEVYYALFTPALKNVRPTQAQVVDRHTFADLLKSNRVIFFGDGAAKCRTAITGPNAVFLEDVWPTASGMVAEAERLFHLGDFVDVAYFEPFYLKDFLAGTPKVKGLYT